MARLGMNPNRDKLVKSDPPAYTLSMITHLPYMSGYHKGRKQIIELSLNSMMMNSFPFREEYQVVVFDNGSCREWQTKLLEMVAAGYIDQVILSHHNIGKPAALRVLMGASRTRIFGYSDDDILFYENWFMQQIHLLTNFPNVAKVSGVPVKSLFPHYLDQSHYDFKGNDGTVKTEVGQWFPREWLEDDAMGRGMPIELYLKVHGDDEILLKTGTVEAFGHGHHCQFLGYRDLLLEHLPDSNQMAMGRMREWDNAIQDSGLYQITTKNRTARHMGNVLDSVIVNEVIEMGLVL